jgi:hypothetical protein
MSEQRDDDNPDRVFSDLEKVVDEAVEKDDEELDGGTGGSR